MILLNFLINITINYSRSFVFLQKPSREAFQKHGFSAPLRPLREILRICES